MSFITYGKRTVSNHRGKEPFILKKKKKNLAQLAFNQEESKVELTAQTI